MQVPGPLLRLTWRFALTSVLVELGLVQVVDDFGDRLDRTVPLGRSALCHCREGTHSPGCNVHLEVSTDEELATHFGGCFYTN